MDKIRHNPYCEGMRVTLGHDLLAKGFNEKELAEAMYRLTATTEGEGLLCEAADFDEVNGYYCPGDDMVLEAVTIPRFSQAEKRMAVLRRVFNKHLKGHELEAMEPIVGKPKKSGLFAYVTVQVPISDGQTVSVIFHSPEGDRKKIGPDDSLIAFRWLLNKRDITQVVAPESGASDVGPMPISEVSLDEVGKRVAQLTAKNSEKFVSRNAQAAEEVKRLEEVRVQADEAEKGRDALLDQIQETRNQAATAEEKAADASAKLESTLQDNADLQAQIEALKTMGEKGEATSESETLKELKKEARDLVATLAAIKNGSMAGYELALFRQSFVGKLDRRLKAGRGEDVAAALEYLKEIQGDSPALAARNGIWKKAGVDPKGGKSEPETAAATDRYQDAKDRLKTELESRNFTIETINGVETFRGPENGRTRLFVGMDDLSKSGGGYTVTAWDETNGSEGPTQFYKTDTIDELDGKIDEALAWVDAELAKGGEETDPNIGREWDSPYGRQRIVELDETGPTAYYRVLTPETGATRLYQADQIEEVIKKDEYRLTPEYEAEVKEREETQRLKEESYRRQEEARQKTLAEIEVFTKAHGMSSIAAGKAREALLALSKFNGVVSSRKNYIEKEVEAGRRVRSDIVEGKRVFGGENGFMAEKDITKTGMDYAEFLISQKEAEATNPDTPATEEKETEAVNLLQNIIGGDMDEDPDGIDNALDQAAEALEELGKMEEYDELLNQAADHYTGILEKLAKGVM